MKSVATKFRCKIDTDTDQNWKIYHYQFGTYDVSLVHDIITWCAELENQCQYYPLVTMRVISDMGPAYQTCFTFDAMIYGDVLAVEFKLRFDR